MLNNQELKQIISEDAGRMLENSVFLELNRHRNAIYFYREKNDVCYTIYVKPVWRWLMEWV